MLGLSLRLVQTPGPMGSSHDKSLIIDNVEGYGRVALTGDLWQSKDPSKAEVETWATLSELLRAKRRR